MQGIFFENFETSFIPEILQELYKDRVYEPFLKGKKDLTILDIGANIGLFSFYSHKYAKKIYAVEPDPIHCNVMEKMLDFNKIDNVEIIQKAVSGKNSKLSFYSNPKNATMNSLINTAPLIEKSLDYEEREVEAVDFETLFKENKIKHVDFMKLDIEGSEVEVVCGNSFEKVASKIDTMVVEYHTWSGVNPSQLVNALKDYGFTVKPLQADAKLFVAFR